MTEDTKPKPANAPAVTVQFGKWIKIKFRDNWPVLVIALGFAAAAGVVVSQN